MIKGVNMQVVEIKDTGNVYFEKVLLFVNPEFYGTDSEKLKKIAWDFTNTIGMPPPTKKKLDWKNILLKASFAIGSGIAIVAAIISF